MRHVFNGALRGFKVMARLFTEVGLGLEQNLGVQGHRRYGVVDVVRDAAGHLPQGAQPLLLQDGLLRLTKIVIGVLQSFVNLSLMSRQSHVLAYLAEKFTVSAAEALRFVTGGDENPKHLALHLERRENHGL